MASLEAGRRLADRYELKERLGDGGHAEVWSALNVRSGELVALKFLHARCGAPGEALPVLRHEARMAHRLDHPGVLRVQEPQRDGECVFLPMEYAAGGSAARLRGAPWRRVLPVLLAVARVLEHAHARGIVHRDIKPGNVLFDTDGQVRVADFGTSASTGSSEALADGSPFSASPQQLRGDTASPADDVYGLGALTHELLTRYPPFYPQFDARRVQLEDPPRPVPTHPAPEQLLDLVQAMLARDAAARPMLAEVIGAYERCLALPESPDEATFIIEAARAHEAQQPARQRRWPSAWWGLGAAAAAGAVVLVLLPKPPPQASLVVAEAAPGITRVADALVVESAPPAGPVPGESQPATAAQAEATGQSGAGPVAAAAAVVSLEEELRAGQQALDRLQPAQARAAFRRALVLQADDATALAGLAAAARQEEQLAVLALGTRAEAAGDLQAAREQYRQLLAGETPFAPARSALARVDARLADQAFEDHLAAAAEALRRGDVAAAASAYARAASIHPRDERVQDGQQRIAEIERDRRNAQDLAAGTGLEAAERWDEAIAHYRGVLDRDAGLQFAQDGLVRSERRAALDRELADYLARPERLTAAAVRQAAQRALARGEASAADAPRLQVQLESLRARLGVLSQPVRVELTSDNSTRVSVMPVGELGAFEQKELELPPGQYTIVGRREGFRDVRYELNLAPGQRVMVLAVQCTERI